MLRSGIASVPEQLRVPFDTCVHDGRTGDCPPCSGPYATCGSARPLLVLDAESGATRTYISAFISILHVRVTVFSFCGHTRLNRSSASRRRRPGRAPRRRVARSARAAAAAGLLSGPTMPASRAAQEICLLPRAPGCLPRSSPASGRAAQRLGVTMRASCPRFTKRRAYLATASRHSCSGS